MHRSGAVGVVANFSRHRGIQVGRDAVTHTDGQKLEALALANGIAALFANAGPGGDRGVFAHLDGRRHFRVAAALAGVAAPTSASDPFPRVLAAVLHATLGTTPDAAPKARRPGRSNA